MSDPEIEIERIAAGGAGIGTLPDGKATFVPRSAPGDRLRVRIDKKHRRWAKAEIVQILRRGPNRVLPECSLYDRCGGCALQHLAYPAQLQWKSRIVADALNRIGGFEVEPPPIEPSTLTARYRNRITLTLRRLPSGPVVAGFHSRRDPGRIVDMHDECILPTGRLAATWRGLRDSWGPQARHLPAGSPLRLTLRQAGVGVALVIEGARGPGAPEMLFRGVPELDSIWFRTVGGAYRRAAARPGAAPPDHLGFVQANDSMLPALTAWQVSSLSPRRGERILDGFGGDGRLAARLAADGAEVIVIESDPEAAGAARARGSVQVVEGLVEERLEGLLPTDAAHLNPPRTGLHEAVPEVLGRLGPDRVVYTSCDPATLARDLDRMRAAYELSDLRCFDLFPQTAHVETVAVLTRKRGPDVPHPPEG